MASITTATSNAPAAPGFFFPSFVDSSDRPLSSPRLSGSAGGYAAAVGFALLAIGVRTLLDPVLGSQTALFPLTAGVVTAGWLGGLGPALLATLIGGLAVDASLFTGRLDGAARLDGVVPLIMFAVTGGVIALASGALHRRCRSLAADEAHVAAQLFESELRFQEIADAAPVYIWRSDRDGNCTWFNRPWLDFRGRTVDAERGRGWMEGIHPDDQDRYAHAEVAAFETRRPLTIDYRLRRFDGEYRWVVDHGVPLHDGHGRFDGFVGSCLDITTRKAAEAEHEMLLARERAARSDAERATRLKDEFLSTLSHELRTPLNAILGWTHLLRETGPDPAALLRGLAVIERNAHLQTRIVEDLLDMSRIITGKMRLERRVVGVAAVVDAAIESLKPAFEAKGLSLSQSLDRTTTVIGDPARLQQVVWNLLSNALKFTPKGGLVDVRIAVVGSEAQLTVHDTGRGIQPEFLPHVFERFRQEDASTRRSEGGLGLGLALVKHITELHGGAVRASSAGETRGSTFIVTLPLAVGPQRTEPAGLPLKPAVSSPSSVQIRRLDGVKVLVVDDDQGSRMVAGRLLAEHGAVVTTASGASEALALYDSFAPDVLLSDIGLTGADGGELLTEIRRREADLGHTVFAIALTALTGPEDQRRVHRAGFEAHVSKPVEPAELIDVVATVAHRAIRA